MRDTITDYSKTDGYLVQLKITTNLFTVGTVGDGEETASRVKIQKFIDSFPHDKVARASLNCKSYARCLLHYEHHMEGDSVHDHLDTLQVFLLVFVDKDKRDQHYM